MAHYVRDVDIIIRSLYIFISVICSFKCSSSVYLGVTPLLFFFFCLSGVLKKKKSFLSFISNCSTALMG